MTVYDYDFTGHCRRMLDAVAAGGESSAAGGARILAALEAEFGAPDPDELLPELAPDLQRLERGGSDVAPFVGVIVRGGPSDAEDAEIVRAFYARRDGVSPW
jgi:hypothetical protein